MAKKSAKKENKSPAPTPVKQTPVKKAATGAKEGIFQAGDLDAGKSQNAKDTVYHAVCKALVTLIVSSLRLCAVHLGFIVVVCLPSVSLEPRTFERGRRHVDIDILRRAECARKS